MIYLDSSAVLARLFGEGREPRETLWTELLISSRLLEYEVWNRIHAHRLADRVGGAAGLLFNRIRLVELTPRVLAKALQPFPGAVRTLDALHLATILFLRAEGETVELASYDNHLLAAARLSSVPVADI